MINNFSNFSKLKYKSEIYKKVHQQTIYKQSWLLINLSLNRYTNIILINGITIYPRT